MKKIISLLLVFILGIALIGCENKEKSDNTATKSDVKSKASEKKTYCDKDFINDVLASINDSELDKDYSDIDFDSLITKAHDYGYRKDKRIGIGSGRTVKDVGYGVFVHRRPRHVPGTYGG